MTEQMNLGGAWRMREADSETCIRRMCRAACMRI